MDLGIGSNDNIMPHSWDDHWTWYNCAHIYSPNILIKLQYKQQNYQSKIISRHILTDYIVSEIDGTILLSNLWQKKEGKNSLCSLNVNEILNRVLTTVIRISRKQRSPVFEVHRCRHIWIPINNINYDLYNLFFSGGDKLFNQNLITCDLLFASHNCTLFLDHYIVYRSIFMCVWLSIWYIIE